MIHYDTNPRVRRLKNELYEKRQCNLYKQLQILQIPYQNVPYIRYVNRQIEEPFFRNFFNCDYMMTNEPSGCYMKEFDNDAGEEILWFVWLDENKRIIKVAKPSVRRFLGLREDTHPGSDHMISEWSYRDPSQEEIDDFYRSLDDLSRHRAEVLLAQIPKTEFQIGKRVYSITESGLTSAVDKRFEKVEIPMKDLIELIEWSFTYLECFVSTYFIRANIVGFDDISKAIVGKEFMSLFNPRTFYDYPHLLKSAVYRAMQIGEMCRSFLSMPTSSDYERRIRWEKTYAEHLESCFIGKIGIDEEGIKITPPE